MKISLLEIRKMIEGVSEDARFAAWTELYTSKEPEAFHELNRMIDSNDPILKILLIRFLGGIDESRAVSLLVPLLDDANSVVVEAAKKGFERNRFDQKLKFLLPLVKSSSQQAQFYAIEQLALGGVMDVLDLLINKLPQADELLLNQILMAFRILPEKRLIPLVLPFFNHQREEIRYKTVHVLGAVYEMGHLSPRRWLLKALKDPSPRIRQASLWCLRRRKHLRDLKYLFAISLNDPDPFVRQESFNEMALFPQYLVIKQFLKVLTQEKNRNVLLKGEGIVASLPKEKLNPALKKLLKGNSSAIRNRALLLLAENSKKSSFLFRFIVSRIKKTEDKKEKVILMEALGILEDKKAIPLLESCLGDETLISYVAITSLLSVWKKDPDMPALDYLQKKGLSPLARQLILRHVIRYRPSALNTPEMEEHLVFLLQDSNLNVRYLATQVLGLIQSQRAFEPMVITLQAESDPTTFKLLKQSVIASVKQNPDLLLQTITKFGNNPQIVKTLLELMKEVILDRQTACFLLRSLFQSPLSLLGTPFHDDVMVFVLNHLSQQRISFDDILDVIEKSRERIFFITSIAKACTRGDFYLPPLPFERLKKWFDEGEEKEALIELFGLSGQKEAQTCLIAMSAQTTDVFRPAISRAVNRLLGLSGGGP